ncbi:MAG TPA: ferritin-like domain-containing protein [Bryobacteraceae bacterium]|jgi:ferritin-like metal-binding protein YciE
MATAKVSGSEQLLNQELQDMYDAEKQLVRALPKMAKAASDEELRNALREHLEVTKGQVQRLEQLFESMDMRARSRPCKGMRGIVEEGREVMEEDLEAPMADAAIVAAGRRVEHYEMAAYETLRDMVRQMGNREAAQMIEETLREEIQADKQLAQIGKRLFKEAGHPQAERTEGRSSRGTAKGSTRGTKAQAKTARRSRSQATRGSGRRVSRVLTDPEEIRQWAEERGAQPACVKGTGGRQDVGMIRLDFPGWGSDEKLQPINWDEWTEKFEESGLALIVEEETARGQKSNFNKLVSRKTAEGAKARGVRARSAH